MNSRGARRQTVRRGRARAPIALLTDFGYRDHYVGVMKGVIASIAPAAPIIDITHGVPAQSVTAGAIALRAAASFFPPRTVFLAVVDPGVGTSRRAVAVETRDGARWVGPDNGLLSLAVECAGFARAVEITSQRHRFAIVSATFHGRDIFAPAAAHLWRGAPLRELGPSIARIQSLKLPAPSSRGREVRGEVLYVDGFGNLVSNIGSESIARLRSRFAAKKLSVRIGRSAPIMLRPAYADAPRSAPLAIVGSLDLVEVAVRDGRADARFAAGPGTQLVLSAGGK
ncbi:MAG: SAM hydrolase/SAM-dependent halogenase family protein [Candidatus Binataceae bacterium]